MIVKKFRLHIFIYALCSAVVCVYLYIDFAVARQILLFVAGVISLLYTLPIFGDGRRLRDFSFIKILLISCTWTMVTDGLILYEAGFSYHTVALASLERFCYILAITIPFDVRDMEIDEAQHVPTLATILGASKSKFISYALFIISGIAAVAQGRYDTNSLIAILTCYTLSLLAVFYTHRERSDYWYTGIIDGLMMTPLLLLLLLNAR